LRHKIFYKLLITLIITFSSLLILMLIVINWSFRQGFDQYLLQKELATSRQVAVSLAGYYQQHGSWTAVRNNPKIWRELLQETAQLFATDRLSQQRRPPPEHKKKRHGFDDTPPRNFKRPPPPPERGSPRPPGNNVEQRTLANRLLLTDADKQRVFGPPEIDQVNSWQVIEVEGATVGWLGLIALKLETDSVARNFVNQQYTNIAMFSLFGWFLTFIVSICLARLFTRPVGRVAKAATLLANGNLTTRVAVEGKDELAQLSTSFNQMATKLERNEQLRRQWISDISHELRTPISVLSGEIEAIRDGIRQPTNQRLASLYSDVKTLTKLVDDLHQLSMSDHGTLKLQIEPLDLAELCRHQHSLFKPRMADKQLVLNLQIIANQDFMISGDPNRLCQLISNLLENSMRYTHAEGRVTTKLNRDTDWITLIIADSAPNVPEQDLSQIFQRLYRVDKSRSSTNGGSGLGLAICEDIVSMHAGVITANNNNLGGLDITIRLPIIHDYC